ncbi:MAG: hypothetical protein Q8N77_05915 [Nanoarchaeota archaeon]|nr:hypothetical protein [Nanoarchaeota archaeon]
MTIDQKVQNIYDVEEPGIATPYEIGQYLDEQKKEIRAIYKKAFTSKKTEAGKQAGAQLKYTKFEVIRTNTFAMGIAKLKEQGQKPFTFSENIEARIADYEANGNDAELFKNWFNSVTGVAYKVHSTRFKLILRSDKLENIKPDFNQRVIPIDYDAEQGVEFDSRNGVYNQGLTREEAKVHEFWLAAMGGDKKTLVRYVDVWFDKTGKEKGMGVYLRSNTSQDELRVLVLDRGYYGSDACGDSDLLDSSARFLSGAQQK